MEILKIIGLVSLGVLIGLWLRRKKKEIRTFDRKLTTLQMFFYMGALDRFVIALEGNPTIWFWKDPANGALYFMGLTGLGAVRKSEESYWYLRFEPLEFEKAVNLHREDRATATLYNIAGGIDKIHMLSRVTSDDPVAQRILVGARA